MSTQKCLNAGYDILTILISIADVATDIIVLIDWYNKERMAFFFISLSILILAQCAYSIAFALKSVHPFEFHTCITTMIMYSDLKQSQVGVPSKLVAALSAYCRLEH